LLPNSKFSLTTLDGKRQLTEKYYLLLLFFQLTYCPPIRLFLHFILISSSFPSHFIYLFSGLKKLKKDKAAYNLVYRPQEGYPEGVIKISPCDTTDQYFQVSN
jgi:hypothetical protein